MAELCSYGSVGKPRGSANNRTGSLTGNGKRRAAWQSFGGGCVAGGERATYDAVFCPCVSKLAYKSAKWRLLQIQRSHREYSAEALMKEQRQYSPSWKILTLSTT